MSHYIQKCKHGKVISQCRCPSPDKFVQIIRCECKRHECQPPPVPPLGDGDEDDWTCPECGQRWFVGSANYCPSCHRSDGPAWERSGTLDGFPPLIQVRRGGLQWGRRL